MSNDSPAAILFDEFGNAIGVIFDGTTYRLQTQSILTDGTSNTVGITNVSGQYALKVDVIKTVSSGGMGSGGTSSNFGDPFPPAGTAAGFSDGYAMQGVRAFNLDTGLGTEYVLGVNLRTENSSGSLEFGTLANPIRIDPTGTTTQPISGIITANQGTNPWTTDVSDRAGRLLGIVYGSQDQQIKQTATNFNTQVEIAVGSTLIDPRAIRNLTSSDTITVVQTTASNLNATVAQGIAASLSGKWPVQITDGTNTMPTGDVVGRAIFSKLTDGTNTVSITASNALKIDGSAVVQPVSGTITANIGTTGGLALDSSVNGILLSQGSSTSGEKGPLIQGAVSTSVPSYTTGQTSPLSLTTSGLLRVDASGTSLSGTITANQGTPNSIANSWPVEITDGTNILGTSTHPLRIDPTGSTTQPISGTITANIGTTGGLALDTSVNGILVSQGSTTSGEKGPLIQGAATTSAPSYTTGQTSPLSLTLAGALRIDGSATTQPISGTVAATQGTSPWVDNISQFGGNNVVTGTGASGAGIPRVTVSNDSNILATQSGSWTVNANQGIATTLSGAWPVEITDGTNILGTSSHPVRIDPTGTTTQPISGTVTANAGTGNFAVNITQVSGSSVSTAATGIIKVGITDSSGTAINLGQTTMSASVPVVLASDQTAIPVTVSAGTDRTATGNITNTQNVAINTQASGSCGIQITGTWTGTLVFEATVDNSTWNAVNAIVPTSGNEITSTTSNGIWIIACAGYQQIRIRGNTVGSGTATVVLDSSSGTQIISLGNSLPAGNNIIGSVTQSGSWTITANQGTSPWVDNITQFGGTNISTGTGASGSGIPRVTVSNDSNILATQSGTWTVQPGNTPNTTPWLTTINQGGNSATVTAANALKVDGSAVTQPISGTVTSNQGTAAALSGAWPVEVTDGSNILGTSSHPIKIDPTGTTTQPVSGTVTANIGTTGGLALDTSVNGLLLTQGSTTSGEKGPLIQGAVSTSSPTYTTAQTSPLSLTTAGALRIDGSAVTQPVSGTITANAGTGNFDVNITQISGSSVSTATTGVIKVGISDSSGNSIALGQTTMANSVPVVIASNQSAISVAQSGSWTVNLGSTEPNLSNIAQSLNMTATTNTVALAVPGTGTATIQITGAWTGTIIFEATVDGSNWFTINSIVPTTGVIINTTTINGEWLIPCAGYAQIRARCSVIGTNSATVSIEAADGTQTVSLANSIPSGSNTIGSVSQNGSWTVQPGNTPNTTPWLATINQGGNSATVTASNALKVDGSAVTQPISGTVTANAGTGTFTVAGTVTSNQGTAGSLAGAWPVEITDGTNVLGTSSHPVRIDPTGTTTQPISGAITANIGTTGGLALDTSVNGILLAQGSTTSGEKGPLIQGAVTTSSPTYTNAQTSPLSLTTAGALRIDGSAITQPISGTVTANQGTTPWTDNITQFGGSNIATGTGASGSGIPRVTVSNDSNILATQSGSWIVTSDQGTAAALSGKWPVQVTDGTHTLPTGDAAARAIFEQITDGTNGPAAVKAASTMPIATDPALVVVISPNQQAIPVNTAPANAVTGVSFGRVRYGNTSNVLTAITATTYTEQTVNFTGSVKSSSANDAAAGTGARTVIITYYDQTGAGPNTETVTLNGTTAVNLVNTNHCFIEKMVVVTVGSNGANDGTISLFTGSGGTGTTVGSIGFATIANNIGDNTTLWAHHYTPVGKTTSIYLLSGGTVGNQNASFSLFSKQVLTANAAEVEISDSLVSAANSDSVVRQSANPIKISGFARITLYVVSSGSNQPYSGGFDYSDQ